MTVISYDGAPTSITGIAIAASGNGRRLTAFVGQNRSPYNATSALFNAVGGTPAGAVHTDSTNYHARIFYWLDADLPSGAGSYNLTNNGAANTTWVAYLYEEGVPQTAPDQVLPGNTSGTTIQAALTSAAAGATCFKGVTAQQVSGSLTAITDTTMIDRVDASGSPAADYFAGFSLTNTTIGCTAGSNLADSWYGVAYNPASGAPAEITSVTGDGADTVRAGESFTVETTDFTTFEDTATATLGGVACTIVSEFDGLVTVTAPATGLLFDDSTGYGLVLTDDDDNTDTYPGVGYLPPTGFEHITYDSGGISGMTAESFGWNSATSGPYSGLTADDQSYWDVVAVKVDGEGDPVEPEVTATAVLEEGTGNVSITDVTEPGDYAVYGYFRDGDGTDTALVFIFDATAPTLSGAAVNAAGTQITLTLSDAAAIGADGNGGVTLSATGGAVTAAFDSVSTVNVVYDLSRTVYPGETVTVTYAQPGAGITDEVGNPLASFSAQAVTNNSEANHPPSDIQITSTTVRTDAGVNALVGTLSTTDADVGDTHTYTLVAGTGDTDNASFNISGASLRCNDPAALGVGPRSVRVQADDGDSAPFAEALSIAVVETAEEPFYLPGRGVGVYVDGELRILRNSNSRSRRYYEAP